MTSRLQFSQRLTSEKVTGEVYAENHPNVEKRKQSRRVPASPALIVAISSCIFKEISPFVIYEANGVWLSRATLLRSCLPHAPQLTGEHSARLFESSSFGRIHQVIGQA